MLHTQERVRLDDLLISELVADADADGPRWYSLNQAYLGNGTVDFYHSTDSGGVREGNCGTMTLGFGYANEANPRSSAAGSGFGLQDFNGVTTRCWFWSQIPSTYIKRPGTLYVWPYFDIHGYYWVRANDGFWTSKEAEIKLTMHTRLHRYNYQYAPWFSWVVRNRGNDNIDEEGRVDYSGYNNDAKGVLQVLAGEAP